MSRVKQNNIDPVEFNFVIKKVREYCYEKGLTEAGVQHRKSIMAACEDPKNLTVYKNGGQIWPLPQTGQMQLEVEMLKRPNLPGYFTLSTSYRDEPNPLEGRHDRIFPLFEFEIHGDMEDLIEFEAGLLRHLGFDLPEKLKTLDLSESPEECRKANRGKWDDVVKFLGLPDDCDDISAEEEEKINQTFGPVFFLTDFPNKTSPFWNMKQDPNNPGYALKVDVILHGIETFGSAERSTSKQEMREQFETISNGEYAQILYDKFGKERVQQELDDYLDFDFVQRAGGGIGFTRLIRAMRLSNLLPSN